MMQKILLLLIFTIVSTHAVEKENIKTVMDTKIKQVIQILKSKSLSQKQKEQKSIQIMDPIFSYPTMAKISLGKKWKTLTKKEKLAFTKAFEKKMKYAYIDKLKLYHNQKVITNKPKQIKKNRITLTTKIIGNHETYKIVNSFFKKKHSNQWYIYDVKLAGVSIIQTYRKQFKAFLKTKSFKQLLNTL
jgi:phospholipid transport system substrate-binding protein